jgi:hypothetical protein
MPSTTFLEIPPEEPVQIQAVRHRPRYGYRLAFHERQPLSSRGQATPGLGCCGGPRTVHMPAPWGTSPKRRVSVRILGELQPSGMYTARKKFHLDTARDCR